MKTADQNEFLCFRDELSYLMKSTHRSFAKGNSPGGLNDDITDVTHGGRGVIGPIFGIGGEFRSVNYNNPSVGFNIGFEKPIDDNPIKSYSEGLFVHAPDNRSGRQGYDIGDIFKHGRIIEAPNGAEFSCEGCNQSIKVVYQYNLWCSFGTLYLSDKEGPSYEGFLHLTLGFVNKGCLSEYRPFNDESHRLTHFFWGTASVSYYSIMGRDIRGIIKPNFGKAMTPSRTNYSGVSMKDMNLEHAYLPGCNLSHSDLSGSRLKGACLQGADLTGANLTNTNLYWANLHGANLTNCNLSGADLRGANMKYARIVGTNLIGSLTDSADFTNSITH